MDGRRVRSEGTWAQARADYAGGLTAAEVCARHDLGLTALRVRARREGWRRCDLPDPDPLASPEADLQEDLDEELAALGDADPAAMAGRAARLAQRALAMGRLTEAEGWTRLWLRLRALPTADARQLGEGERAGLKLQQQVARTQLAQARALAAVCAAGDPHSAHSAHSAMVNATSEDDPAPPRPPPPPLNRAERRRRARLERSD